jgi:predicted GIY-YIG superfamily endonuclease
MNQQFFVNIPTNRPHMVLYTGVANNLIRRVYEHRESSFMVLPHATK